MKLYLCLLLSSVLFAGVILAQEEEGNCEIEGEEGDILTCKYDEDEDEDEDEEEEFCGLETKFKDNTLYSIKSCGCGNWTGKYKKRKKRQARRKGEMRANRNISEYMQTKLKSDSYLKELTEDIEKECYDQDETPGFCPQDPNNISEDGTVPPPEEGGEVSDFTEAMTESISQSSEQVLSGIRRIGNGPVDKEDKEACVWMGWSLKTSKGARELRKEMDKNIKVKNNKKSKKSKKRKSDGTRGSKSKDFDDF